jgi:hypothetical protein
MRRSGITRAATLRGPGYSGLLVALPCVLTLACAAPPLKPLELEMGPDAEITADGLHRAKNAKLGRVWVKPDADFASYTHVMLDPVEVAYKRKPKGRRFGSTNSNFALTKKQTSDLKRRLREAFVAELTKGGLYTMTEEPGSRVLRIGANLIDLVVHVPTENTGGSEQTFTSSTGEMTLLMELHDSLSGEILARVADRRDVRAAGYGTNDLYFSNAVTDTGAVRRVFKLWAEILRMRLEEVHRIEPTEALQGDTAAPLAAVGP